MSNKVDSLHWVGRSNGSRVTVCPASACSASSRFAANTSSTASRRLALASSRVAPCVLAPGNSSIDAMYPSGTGMNTAVSFTIDSLWTAFVRLCQILAVFHYPFAISLYATDLSALDRNRPCGLDHSTQADRSLLRRQLGAFPTKHFNPPASRGKITSPQANTPTRAARVDVMLHRRDAMIRLGPGRLGRPDAAGPVAGRASGTRGPGRAGCGKAKSCILLYLWGGPPQQDMWDLKPDAPDGIRSEFKPIDTVVPGIQICDQMPQIARHTDKLAIIRSFTHPSNAHEVGVYHTLTGKIDNTLAVPRNQRKPQRLSQHRRRRLVFQPAASHAGQRHDSAADRPRRRDLHRHLRRLSRRAARPAGAQAAGRSERAGRRTAWNCPTGIDATRLQARLGLLKLLEEHDRVVQTARPAASRRRAGSVSRAGVSHADVARGPRRRSTWRARATRCATATAATSTARAFCSPGGWSSRACGW